MSTEAIKLDKAENGFVRGLGLIDSTMIVAGSMIGSGIFIVSADIARHTGSPGGLLLTWIITGLLTIFAALSYGELAAMMPKAGGQYVYLRESYSPLWGFLYGWTLFLVIQTGTIAAVAVAFARFLGVLFPWISAENYLVSPIHISANYAISLSAQQLIAILMIVFLTFINTRGLALGKWIQNVFTSAKTLSLILLILIGIFIGGAAGTFARNWENLFVAHNPVVIKPDYFEWFLPEVTVTSGLWGVIVAYCVAQVGSLFSSDAWNNITFTAGEVKNPERNIPLSLVLGTGLVITLYILANFAYLSTLSIDQIQNAPDDRVGTAALQVIFGDTGAIIMAIAIIISTFGCNNGLVLAGARVYYAMAKDGLFFKATSKLNNYHVPAVALVLQGIWTCLLVLPRTIQTDSSGVIKYGNLYSTLLDYVVFAVLIFYILTITGLFVLRKKKPEAERPYKAFGYPVIPIVYIIAAGLISFVLLFYKPKTSLPGLLIVLTGVPVYWIWKKLNEKQL
ncbi:MAG: amino acid permease [Pyrinomonadaceae bacterium]|nr:amino acid permease [Pyrinomonadaceae bacterium]MCX7639843.1 amino acid permease [Pyrinomonadaceae bacterium]MDW8304015.1 amino acid permease [Acidobacteriota bacterium]